MNNVQDRKLQTAFPGGLFFAEKALLPTNADHVI